MSTPGRKVAIAIRSALLLSDTKEAMDYLKKYGQLKLYAEIRGKTEDEVEKTLGSTKTALKADGSLAFDI